MLFRIPVILIIFSPILSQSPLQFECANCNAWLCQDCGNLNYQSRNNCNKKECGSDRPAPGELYDTTYSFIAKYNDMATKQKS